jgi:hypothetical protein
MAKSKRSTKKKTKRAKRNPSAKKKVKKSAKAARSRSSRSSTKTARTTGARVRAKPNRAQKLSQIPIIAKGKAAQEAFLPLAVADLDLSTNAKAAAESLLKQFGPDKIGFTSGRRDVAGQAKAMAGHVVNKRDWIIKTYVDAEDAAELQKWVDENPQATTVTSIADGLKSVMDGWDIDKLRRLSWHLTGDAFDLMPIPSPAGDEIVAAIKLLPNYNKFLPKEDGDIVWHVQIRNN